MLEPSNKGSSLQPRRALTYGAAAVVVVLVGSVVLHAIFGLLSFVVEVVVVVAVVAVVFRFLGIGRRH